MSDQYTSKCRKRTITRRIKKTFEQQVYLDVRPVVCAEEKAEILLFILLGQINPYPTAGNIVGGALHHKL
jgi:hypothetical protein